MCMYVHAHNPPTPLDFLLNISLEWRQTTRSSGVMASPLAHCPMYIDMNGSDYCACYNFVHLSMYTEHVENKPYSFHNYTLFILTIKHCTVIPKMKISNETIQYWYYQNGMADSKWIFCHVYVVCSYHTLRQTSIFKGVIHHIFLENFTTSMCNRLSSHY